MGTLRSKSTVLGCAAFIAGCTQTPTQTPPKAASASPAVEVAPPPPEPEVHVEGPRIRLALKEIRLDSTSVGWDPTIIRDRMHKIDPLFQALREHRDSTPGARVTGECVFEIEPDVPFLAAASAIMTGAFAGYPVAWISTGSGWLKLRTPTPPLAGAAPAPENATPSRRQIALHVGPTLLDLTVFAVVPPAGGAGREQLDTVLNRMMARGAEESRELSGALVEGCRGAPRPCPRGMWLTADVGMLYGDVSGSLRAIVDAQGGKSAAGGAEILVSFRSHGDGAIDQRPPAIRGEATQVSGRLAPEEIQRIVRTNFGAFRACYEEGLKRNPKLEGRVNVRFVIGKDGRVTQAGAPADLAPKPGSQAPPPRMPDEKVVACIVGAFEKLVFPAPDSGMVTVVYPINFSSGN
jgi:hypothetical protein